VDSSIFFIEKEKKGKWGNKGMNLYVGSELTPATISHGGSTEGMDRLMFCISFVSFVESSFFCSFATPKAR